MTYEQARDLATWHRLTLDRDYHALPSDIVDRVIAAADARKYRQPRNANGSRARYFYALLQRTVARGPT